MVMTTLSEISNSTGMPEYGYRLMSSLLPTFLHTPPGIFWPQNMYPNMQTKTFSVATRALDQNIELDNVVAIATSTGQPCEVWDLHVGATLLVMGR